MTITLVILNRFLQFLYHFNREKNYTCDYNKIYHITRFMCTPYLEKLKPTFLPWLSAVCKDEKTRHSARSWSGCYDFSLDPNHWCCELVTCERQIKHAVALCPNSIRSILSETRSPTCRRPGRRQVADQVRDFFICRKLVARSISTCWDRSILSETRSPTFFGLWLVCDMSETCSKHVGDLVLSRFWAR